MGIKIEVFVTPSCASCKPAFDRIDELVKELGDEYPDIKIEKIDVTLKENLPKAWKHGIATVPTIVVAGKDKLTGVPEKKEIRNIIEKYSKRG